MDAEQFAQRLKAAIRHAGYSRTGAQKVLEEAKVRGASHSNFFKVLAGKTVPSAAFVAEASQRFHVSADWLLTGEGTMERSEIPTPEEIELFGFRDLPAVIQGDVENLAHQLIAVTNTTGLNLEDTTERTAVLTRGIAAWLRLPLHSNKTRELDSDLERTAYFDAALRAFRMLVPSADNELRPGGLDDVLMEIADLEEAMAKGKQQPSTGRKDGE